MTKLERVLIVGGGQAGFETAFALRSRGYSGKITIIGDETGVPYQRPPLSKGFLHEPDVDALALRPSGFFTENEIVLRSGERVLSINRAHQTVNLSSSACLAYDHLVLATGTRNRALPGTSDLQGVHYLRTLSEANDLHRALAATRELVVIGAGFIGLEVAAAATARGTHVTVVEPAERAMARAVSKTISSFFAEQHQAHGVSLRFATTVEKIVENAGRVTGVRTGDGAVINADLVIVGIGVVPNTELASGCGLLVDNGIVVDEQLLTADPAVSAVGDCAAYPSAKPGIHQRLESVQNAVHHARCVAGRLAGERVDYASVPWFWTHQYDCKLQMAGIVAGHSHTVTRGQPAEHKFSVFCFSDDGTLLGVESVNRPADHIAARKILNTRPPLSDAQAADLTFDLSAYSKDPAPPRVALR